MSHFYKILMAGKGNSRRTPHMMCEWKPRGKWMPRLEGKLKACRNGYHLCTLRTLREWLATYQGYRAPLTVWLVKVEGKVSFLLPPSKEGKKHVARRVALVKPIAHLKLNGDIDKILEKVSEFEKKAKR